MSPIRYLVRRRMRAFVRLLRALSRDDAYERYLQHARTVHTGQVPMSRREFYLSEQERKWSGISRCC